MKSAACGRVLTVYALTPVLTAVPVIGAVLRSEATPSLK